MIFLFALVLSLVNIYVKSYLVCFFCSALFGVCDCSFLNFSCLLCNQDFQGRLEAFSLFKFFQGVTVALVLILNVILSGQPVVIITVVCLALTGLNILASLYLQVPLKFNDRFAEAEQSTSGFSYQPI